MKTIILENGDLKASFLPEMGLNLISFQKGGFEVIAQSTRPEFERRFAGLGPLIGPHFHHQKKEWIAKGFDPSLFPHIARVQMQGTEDPFSHGIARYVPWKCAVTKTSIHGRLSGKDTYRQVPLSNFEGADFEMEFRAELTHSGLEISMRVQSTRACLSGLHYYYDLIDQKGSVFSVVQDVYNDMGVFKPMPKEWCEKDLHHLNFNLENFADYGFLPFKENRGEILLQTGKQQILIEYQGEDEQISWQLYSPKGASFVCIEPMSAKNPRGLEALKSGFSARIEIRGPIHK